MEIRLDTHVRLRSQQVAWRHTGEEVIALDLGTNEYLALEGTASELWRRLIDPITGEELAAQLTDVYSVDLPRARDDVSAFLQELYDRDLLEVVDKC